MRMHGGLLCHNMEMVLKCGSMHSGKYSLKYFLMSQLSRMSILQVNWLLILHCSPWWLVQPTRLEGNYQAIKLLELVVESTPNTGDFYWYCHWRLNAHGIKSLVNNPMAKRCCAGCILPSRSQALTWQLDTVGAQKPLNLKQPEHPEFNPSSNTGLKGGLGQFNGIICATSVQQVCCCTISSNMQIKLNQALLEKKKWWFQYKQSYLMMHFYFHKGIYFLFFPRGSAVNACPIFHALAIGCQVYSPTTFHILFHSCGNNGAQPRDICKYFDCIQWLNITDWPFKQHRSRNNSWSFIWKAGDTPSVPPSSVLFMRCYYRTHSSEYSVLMV